MNGVQNPPPARPAWRRAHPRRNVRSLSNVSTVCDFNCIRIFIGDNGDLLFGEVKDDTLFKSVQASIHFLHSPPAIAFDIHALDKAKQLGARKVLIFDTESGKEHRTLISTIYAKGFPLNRGHGDQIALPLEYWSVGNDPYSDQLELWEVRDA